MDRALCQRASRVRDQVFESIQLDDFAGADPFDGLESPVLGALGFRQFRLARLAGLQGMKHAPEFVRRAMRMPPLCNPKTLALMLGAADGVPLGNETVRGQMASRLIAMQNADGGWGYPFAWQARAFYARRGQSNAIATCFAVDGLLNGAGLTTASPVLQKAADFLIRDLGRDGYFSYVGNSDAEIHNVSLWCAWIVSRLRPQNDQWQSAVARVLNAQNQDGSWHYGVRSHHRYVDGFHTGYVLDVLDRFRRKGLMPRGIVDPAIERGLSLYLSECFDPDGRVRSRAGKAGYLDAHAVAQALASLMRFGQTGMAEQVLAFALDHLFDAKRGVFYAGLGRFGPDRRVFMRWTQAWMVWALSIMLDGSFATGKQKLANNPDI